MIERNSRKNIEIPEKYRGLISRAQAPRAVVVGGLVICSYSVATYPTCDVCPPIKARIPVLAPLPGKCIILIGCREANFSLMPGRLLSSPRCTTSYSSYSAKGASSESVA